MQGKTYDLPSALYSVVDRFYLKTRTKYAEEGYTIAKLDANVEKIERQNKRVLIAVRFSNNGRYPIVLPRPDRWDARTGDRLEIAAQNVSTKETWNVGLAELSLVGAADDSTASIVILPRESVSVAYLTTPTTKLPAGIYKVDLLVAISASAPDVAPSLGWVDFHSDYKNPTSVTFDSDYPSTPEEWKDYESRKAKEVPPVAPGAAIVEPGAYRETSAWESGAFLVALKQGTVAPAANIKFARWQWTADPTLPVKANPGEACPREGRWLLCSERLYYPDVEARAYSQHERRMRVGEPFPAISVTGVSDDKLYWAWQG
ncbi:hypothetical protein [Caballeronia arvi]|uniref:hypothetical protein n=1 Tax=Caballeronia arvi TaxID=1777135 RepID=UPI00117FC27D|nr:hypothetical protein [Caballeronia arvi]